MRQSRQQLEEVSNRIALLASEAINGGEGKRTQGLRHDGTADRNGRSPGLPVTGGRPYD